MSTIQGSWARPKIVNDGLVLYLDANAPNSYSQYFTPTTWKDLSGNNNNGTLTNGPTFNSGNGGSIVFDGVNDYVSSSYSGPSTSDYTFSVWYNPLSTATTFPLGRGRDGAGDGWSFLLGSDFFWRAGVVKTDGGTVGYVCSSPGIMYYNNWVYLTGVFVGSSTLSLYVNGVLSNSIAVAGSTLRTSTDGWVLGSITTTLYSNMRVASAQVYTKALSAQEVLQNYNATKNRFGL